MKKADKIDALKKLKVSAKSNLGARTINGIISGLCDVIEQTEMGLTKEQVKFILRTIPNHNRYEYVWRKQAKAPRIKWINEQIKKLEKK